MPLLDCHLIAEASFWEWIASPQSVAVAIWTGFGVLTVALLVIARTRWGQVKPMSKCIVLSVFAHLLLMGAAYTSRLLSEVPALPAESTVRFKMISSLDAPVQEVEDGMQPDPWEDVVVDSSITPEPVVAAPREVNADFQVTRSDPAPVPAVSGALPQDAVELAEPQRPVAPLPTMNVLRANSATAAAAEMTIPKPEATATPEPKAQADADPLARRAVEAPNATGPPEHSPIASDRREKTKPNVQTLADVDVLDKTGSMQMGAEDNVHERTQVDSSDASQANLRPGAEESFVKHIDPRVDQMTPVTSMANGVGPGIQANPLRRAVVPLPVRRLGDGELVPETYRLRVAENRLEFAQAHGGNARTEAAVAAALRWLAAHQSEDGRWSSAMHGGGAETRAVLNENRDRAGAKADTGITGLALLAFLGTGHTHLEGEFRTEVQHGLEYLLRQQISSGCMAGEARYYARMYCHGMATLALSEAYAMTGDHRMKSAVQRAIGYSVRSQDATTGGWRYQPGQKGDMSQFGWQVMALRSAESAGIPVTTRTRAGMLRFIRDTESQRRPGLYCYRQGDDVSRTMTAEAMTCRAFLGLPREPASEQIALDFLQQELPGARVDLYYWYYGTLAMYQFGGERWDTWNRVLQERLLPLQVSTGAAAGSWEPNTVWGGYGGRVYTTAMATLCLEVYYRYLPIYQDN